MQTVPTLSKDVTREIKYSKKGQIYYFVVISLFVCLCVCGGDLKRGSSLMEEILNFVPSGKKNTAVYIQNRF